MTPMSFLISGCIGDNLAVVCGFDIGVISAKQLRPLKYMLAVESWESELWLENHPADVL